MQHVLIAKYKNYYTKRKFKNKIYQNENSIKNRKHGSIKTFYSQTSGFFIHQFGIKDLEVFQKKELCWEAKNF